MEKALLVAVQMRSERTDWPIEEQSYELQELAVTSGAQVLDTVNLTCQKPTPNLYIGKGQVEELALAARAAGAGTVIFGRELSGTQQRNLEEVMCMKTNDRTQLILDIFARHARSPEGKMQVELAQLEYLLPRLVGKGIILSRLGGGIGTRGPGETKLEVDRRRIRARIEKLKSDLRDISVHRSTIRKKRVENRVASIALVGYTNAGKSTLLNALTSAGTQVSDGLFTTLDPLSKALLLPNGDHAVLTDTVGFIHDLPHHLVESFKATLEEVRESDLLLHVIDVSHPRIYAVRDAVLEVLGQLSCREKPLITVLNKIDTSDDAAWLGRLAEDFPNPVAVSARTGLHLDRLLSLIQENFKDRMLECTLFLPHGRMEIVDLCYREGSVASVDYGAEGITVRANLPKLLRTKLMNDKEIRLT
jgi:GTP-binding protein HflX